MALGNAVFHEPGASRFVMRLGDSEGELTYRLTADRIYIDYVGVPPQHRNQGLAGQITEAALAHARANGLKVVPICPYAAWYLHRHPEHQDLLDSFPA